MTCQEKFVELKIDNKVLRGTYHKVIDNNKSPCVIFYHGFQGNRIGPRNLYVDFSRILAKKGIASIRFDFSGSGESDGDFVDMTFSQEKEEALSIYDYVSKLKEVDSDKIFILGHSMGASIGGVISYIKKPLGLILWSPAGDLKYALNAYSSLFDKIPFPLDFKGQLVGEKFFMEIENLDLKVELEKYLGSSLLFSGEKDETVPDYVFENFKKWLNTDLIKVSKADHNYSNFSARKFIYKKTYEFIFGKI